MPSMDLAALRNLINELCFERAADVGLFPDSASRDRFINIANRRLYNKVAEISPSTYSQRSADLSLTSSGLDLGGGTLHAQGLHRLVGVERKDANAQYEFITPFVYQEKDMHEGTAWRVDGSAQIYRWTMLGTVLYFYPAPASTLTVRVTFVPGIADMTLTTDTPLGGQFPNHHEIVGYLAAVLALEKDGAERHVKPRYDAMLEEFTAHVRRRQAQRPRRVLITDWSD